MDKLNRQPSIEVCYPPNSIAKLLVAHYPLVLVVSNFFKESLALGKWASISFENKFKDIKIIISKGKLHFSGIPDGKLWVTLSSELCLHGSDRLFWLLLVGQRWFICPLLQWRKAGERTTEVIFWGLENLKSSFIFFLYPQGSAYPQHLLSSFPRNPLWTHMSELGWLPCFRLSSAYCRTNVCIFLLHGSFPWYIPRQWEEPAVSVASLLCMMFALCLLPNFKGWLWVNVCLINVSSARFNLAYLLLDIISLSLLLIHFYK